MDKRLVATTDDSSQTAPSVQQIRAQLNEDALAELEDADMSNPSVWTEQADATGKTLGLDSND